jgi:hypothetical protein
VTNPGGYQKSVQRIRLIAQLLVIAAFFVLWREFDLSPWESFKYCFSAGAIVHTLLNVLRSVAIVLDRARSPMMIVVGIAKFLVSLALPMLWKVVHLPFWESLAICAVVYFALDRIWRFLDRNSVQPN